MDSYFDPFDRLADELIDKARPPFSDAIKRLKVQLAGRFDLYPRDLDEEGVRVCSELEAVDDAIIALCQRYCQLEPHEVVCAPLHRMVLIATPRVKALIRALNSHTARLNAFLDSLEPRLLN